MEIVSSLSGVMGYPSKRPCLWLINGDGCALLTTSSWDDSPSSCFGMVPGGGWGPKCFLFDVFANTFDASWLLFLECTYPKINMEPETGPLERKNIDGKTTNLWVPS